MPRSAPIGYSMALPIGDVPYVNIQDVKANSTGGGSFSAGAWRTRDLNTIVADTAGIAVLASNQITLPAGLYRCAIQVPGYGVNDHVARLQNISTASTIVEGTGGRSSGSSSYEASWIRYYFRLANTSVLEVQHQCETNNLTDGFGRASNFTTDFEHYTVAEFWKVG